MSMGPKPGLTTRKIQREQSRCSGSTAHATTMAQGARASLKGETSPVPVIVEQIANSAHGSIAATGYRKSYAAQCHYLVQKDAQAVTRAKTSPIFQSILIS